MCLWRNSLWETGEVIMSSVSNKTENLKKGYIDYQSWLPFTDLLTCYK